MNPEKFRHDLRNQSAVRIQNLVKIQRHAENFLIRIMRWSEWL